MKKRMGMFKRGVITSAAWCVYAGALYLSFKFNFWNTYTSKVVDFYPTYWECVLFVSIVNLMSFNVNDFIEDDKEEDEEV